MKIGIDLRSLQEKHPAGIGHYASQVCQNLVQLDQENEYFFYFNSWRKISQPSFCQSGRVIHNRWPTKLVNFSNLVFNFPKIDRQPQLDIFWQPSFNFISLSRQVKKVITVHDLSWLVNRSWYSRKMSWWHSLQRVGRELSWADKIVAVSESTKQDIVYWYKIDPAKIEVIYSGVGFVSGSAEKFETELPAKYLLYLGTIEPRKNVLGILETLEKIYQNHSQFREVHLVLAGGQGWANHKVWQKLKNSPFKNNFHYLGYIPDKQKKALIQGSLGFIWPSFYEGYGHPPLEAILLQKPLITSFGSSLPEIVKDKAILVDPYNLASLEAGILQLLRSGANTLTTAEAGQWQAKLDWSLTAKSYLELFKSLN